MKARRTEPTQHLLDGAPYVRAVDTNLARQWAGFFEFHRKQETAESVQASAVAEHQTMNIKRQR